MFFPFLVYHLKIINSPKKMLSVNPTWTDEIMTQYVKFGLDRLNGVVRLLSVSNNLNYMCSVQTKREIILYINCILCLQQLEL